MKSTASPTVQAKPEINKLDGPDTVKGSIYELEKVRAGDLCLLE